MYVCTKKCHIHVERNKIYIYTYTHIYIGAYRNFVHTYILFLLNPLYELYFINGGAKRRKNVFTSLKISCIRMCIRAYIYMIIKNSYEVYFAFSTII